MSAHPVISSDVTAPFELLTHGLNASLNDVMDTDVCLVSPECAIDEALRQLITKAAALLVVVADDGRPVGIVTESDLLPAAVHLIDPTRRLASRTTLRGGARLVDLARKGASPSVGRVYDVMSHPAVWGEPHMTIGLAAALMVTYEQQQLVIAAGGHVVGVVTSRAILTALAPQQ